MFQAYTKNLDLILYLPMELVKNMMKTALIGGYGHIWHSGEQLLAQWHPIEQHSSEGHSVEWHSLLWRTEEWQ